jgi:hypothetical protein
VNGILRTLQRLVEREIVLVERRLKILFVGVQDASEASWLRLTRQVATFFVLLTGAMALLMVSLTDSLQAGIGSLADALNAGVVNLTDALNATVMQLASVAVLPIYRMGANGRAFVDSSVEEVERLRTSVLSLLRSSALILRQRATAIKTRREVRRTSSDQLNQTASSDQQENRRGRAKLTPLQIALVVLVLDLLLRYPTTKLWDFIWSKLFP